MLQSVENLHRPQSGSWSQDIVWARFLKLYEFALSQARQAKLPNSCALDAACGLGYGSAILKHYFKKVVGVDRDTKSLDEGKKHYAQPDFFQADVCHLPFQDACFDMVLSVETLEHLPKEKLSIYLYELLRVLKPGGLFFLSTPNRPIYSAYHQVPDHISELNFAELKKLTGAFGNPRYYGMGSMMGRRLRLRRRIDNFSTLARRILFRLLSLNVPPDSKLPSALDFWDISDDPKLIEDSYLFIATFYKV